MQSLSGCDPDFLIYRSSKPEETLALCRTCRANVLVMEVIRQGIWKLSERLKICSAVKQLGWTCKEGREISYNPPRYEYSYDFYITIFVNNDYFDEIRFKINSDSVDITPPPAMRPGMTTRCNPETNVEYRNCKKLGEEIRQVLTQVRKDVRQQIEQEAAPKTAVTCPYCGATTTPDVNGCCEYCGGAVRG